MLGKLTRSSTLAIALATGLAVAGVGIGAEPAQAQGSKQKSPFSPGFQAAAAPLQQKVEAAIAIQKQAAPGDAAAQAQVAATLTGAPALLAQAEAAAKTPQDKLLAGQFALNIGVMMNDARMAERGARGMLASGQLNPQQTAQVQATLTKLAASGQGDPVAQAVDAHVKANNPQAALAELRKAVAANRAGNRPVPEVWLKRANTIAYNAKLPQEALEWATLHAELYPSNFNWLGSAQLVRRFAPNWTSQENLDLYRLMARTGALNNDPKIVGPEYQQYVSAADPRRLPGEVVRVIDQGVAAGAISNAGWVREARTLAAGRIASDKASLTSLEREARQSATGISALSTADAYLNYGEASKAEELYRLALEKGGVDRNRALTRLGIAQVDQGKYAAAQESFSKITGQRLPLARLWLVYIAQKDPTAVPRRAG